MQIKMVYIPNNISSSALNLYSATSKNIVLNVGQTLNATIKSVQGSQVQLSIGNQTLLASTAETKLQTGSVQVQVKQTQPSIVLSIVSNNKSAPSSQTQQILQTTYRQLMPAQTNVSQAFQQISLLQSLPPALLSPINQLLDQMLKSNAPSTGKELKNRLEQSGLFLESKLKNSETSNVQKDLKAQLLTLKQQSESLSAKAPTTQLLQLTNVLTQAINRLTVQQLQLYENPLITPLELPFESSKQVHKNTIELRQNKQTSPSSWEVLIDTSLPQGELSTKLIMNPQGEISCFLWCETQTLENLIKTQLTTLMQSFSDNELPINSIQIIQQKPTTTQQSTQVALIDIHI